MSASLKPEDRVAKALEQSQHIRNIMIIAHVDHGKTTMSDNLIAQAGLLNQRLAGTQLLLDKGGQEQARGITINTGCISLPYRKDGADYLINLRDTPGHVDFVYQVDKTTRAVEGALLLIDAMQGVKTQTQTVLGLAVNQGLPIILVLNKIDRLIRELNSSPLQVYGRILRVLEDVNSLMTRFTGSDEAYFELDRNVLFGSGLDRWMISTTILREKSIKFSDLVGRIMRRDGALSREFNVAKALLNAVIDLIPEPRRMIGARLRKTLDADTIIPEDLLQGDPQGTFRAFVCDSIYTKTGGSKVIRVLSGTLCRGDTVYASQDGYTKAYRITKIMIDMTRNRIDVERAPAGAIVMVTGLDVPIGTTLSTLRDELIVMPGIKNTKEPVVSLALKTQSRRIPQLLKALRQLCNHDSTLRLDQSQGEIVLRGVGQLQLEVALHQIAHQYGIPVEPGKPRVAYSETISEGSGAQSRVVRTPNGLTDFAIRVERLPQPIRRLLDTTQIDRKRITAVLQAHGYPSELARRCEAILKGGSLYINDTKGAIYMKQCREDISASLDRCLMRGPLTGRQLKGLQIRVTYAKIHQDPKKRSELQFAKAFEQAFSDVFHKKKALLLEPIMGLQISLPSEPTKYLTGVINHLDNIRGVLKDTTQSSIPGYIDVSYELPLSQTFGLNKILMSLCEGRVNVVMSLRGYSPVPPETLELLLKTRE